MKTKVWAHRGASAYAPENTLEAFELAVSQGADGVELDIQMTIEIRRLLKAAEGGFGSEEDLLPVAVPNRLTHQRLAVAAMIHKGGIQIVHPLIHGMADQTDRFFLIDFLPAEGAVERGKPHTAVAQRGHPFPRFSKKPVLHDRFLLSTQISAPPAQASGVNFSIA